MNWETLLKWIDNPILIKHKRSRLRPQAFATSLVVVVILCICIAWGGYQLNQFTSGGAAGTLLALQAILLVIMGAAQVSASVNGARASGILDFHRVSPLTPAEMTLGFLFGAPIREYLLFAATLPFSLLCMAFGVPSPRGFIQLMIMLFVTAWTFHGLGILTALASRAKSPTGSVVGVIVFILFFGASFVSGGTYSVNIVENDHRLDFFGINLPWLPVVLIYQLPLLFFILLAARRKMQSARLHALSKPEAIAAMLTVGTLVLGWIWKQDGYDIRAIAALYILAVPAIFLTMMVTPSQAEYYKGLWRAQKQGRSRLPWWDDLSVNWIFLALLAGIALAAGSVVGAFPGEPSEAFSQPMGSFPLALATTVLVIAYFGLALQYFLLRFAGRGRMYFGLFLFLVWLLPLVGGTILSMRWAAMSQQNEAGQLVFALSPLAAIGMVASIGDESIATAVQGAAITPALLFTFVFNYLLIGARKRVIKSVYLAAASRKQAQDELASDSPILDGGRREDP